jgi:hypothetical protein
MPNHGYSLLILMALAIASAPLAGQGKGRENLPSTDLLVYLGQLVEVDDELIGPEFFDIDEENVQVEQADEVPVIRADKSPDRGGNTHD